VQCGREPTSPAAADELKSLRLELAEVKSTMKELVSIVSKQSDSQVRMEKSCTDVAETFKQMVEVAHRRRGGGKKPQALSTARSSSPPALADVDTKADDLTLT
ncbi:unnamed protein product, partial [Polarella glacialis]